MKNLATLFVLFLPIWSFGASTAEQIEFFESRIRPVLAQECYECHSTAGKQRSGLVLDHREGLLKGGDIGPSVVPGKPDESILIEALLHQNDLTMPKAGVKLEPKIIDDFVRWIEMGAPDPRDHPPTAEELAADTDWPAILERRKAWWSFQPITAPEGSVDDFIRAKLVEAGLDVPSVQSRLILFAACISISSACRQRPTRSLRSKPLRPPIITLRLKAWSMN